MILQTLVFHCELSEGSKDMCQDKNEKGSQSPSFISWASTKSSEVYSLQTSLHQRDSVPPVLGSSLLQEGFRS
jgi:hypothetical protein